MTPDKYAALASTALGAIGTMILFLSSYTLEPFAGAQFGSQESVKQNEGIRRKTHRVPGGKESDLLSYARVLLFRLCRYPSRLMRRLLPGIDGV
jgi:hypothetical protein